MKEPEVKERPKRVAKGEPSARVLRIQQVRSVKEIETFLRKEHPRYHIDEEVELDEFEEIEATNEADDEEEDYMSDGKDEISKEIPTWSNISTGTTIVERRRNRKS